MAKTRKQKVLEEVKKKRQQRTIISMVIVAVLVTTIGVGVWAISRNAGAGANFPFPCLAESVTLHVHPWLRIWIETSPGIGYNITIPIAIGILNPQIVNNFAGGGSCFEPLHTHDSSGVIHIESANTNANFTLGDFFNVWKATPNYSTLNVPAQGNGPGLGSLPVVYNRTDILGFRPDGTHKLSLLIDKGQPLSYRNSTAYESLPLVPLDYCSTALGSQAPCSTAGAGGDPAYGSQPYPFGPGHTITIYYKAV